MDNVNIGHEIFDESRRIFLWLEKFISLKCDDEKFS